MNQLPSLDVEAPQRAAAPLIEGDRLSLSFDGRPVLRDVDIALRPREIVTLIGLNGSGKTTLVRVLLGLVRPEGGRVRRRAGLTIGYMPQRFAVERTMPLTVARFLDLGRRPRGRRPDEVLAEVGAGAVMQRQVANLSGGEMQRVLLARALLGEPDLLVLDEPSANLDVTGQVELYRLIRTIRDRHGCGILLVSHDLHVVMAATDLVVCLNQHVCCSGTPTRVVEDPAFVRLFGPRHGRDLAVYSHEHDHEHDVRGAPVRHDVRGAPVQHDHAGHEHGHDHGGRPC